MRGQFAAGGYQGPDALSDGGDMNYSFDEWVVGSHGRLTRVPPKRRKVTSAHEPAAAPTEIVFAFDSLTTVQQASVVYIVAWRGAVYIGSTLAIADGMSIARVQTLRYSKGRLGNSFPTVRNMGRPHAIWVCYW